jgi:hypothetical protein
MKGLPVASGGRDSTSPEHAIENILADRIRFVTTQAATHANQLLKVHGLILVAYTQRIKLRHYDPKHLTQ